MTTRRGARPEDLAGSFEGMLGLARALPEMLELWRVLSDVLMVQEPGASPRKATKTSSRSKSSLPSDPLALVVRINALMLSSNLRYWMKWQQIVSQRVPRIRRLVDDYRNGNSRDPALRNELLDELRGYLREMAELPADQHRRVRDEIVRIEEEIFAKDQMEQARRWNSAKT